ncbi:MAG: hypothetical protein ACK5NN_00370 [Sphingomonadaceae bacterium]
MRGEISSGKFAKRHPLDWYVDELWCARQLGQALDNFQHERENGQAFWDPACGSGNTLLAAWEDGFDVYGSDVVDTFAWRNFACPYGDREVKRWFSANFLECEAAPAPCSIICNPPYSYVKGIAEAFVRHALTLASGRVFMLLPNKWLATQVRYGLFAVDYPPRAVLHLCQRPSMPPGDRIHLMGSRAFRGGMIDYCWIMWDVQRPAQPGETRAVWLPPLHETVPVYEGLV